MRYSRMEILGSNPDHFFSHPFFKNKDIGKQVTARGIIKSSLPSYNIIVWKDNIKMKTHFVSYLHNYTEYVFFYSFIIYNVGISLMMSL